MVVPLSLSILRCSYPTLLRSFPPPEKSTHHRGPRGRSQPRPYIDTYKIYLLHRLLKDSNDTPSIWSLVTVSASLIWIAMSLPTAQLSCQNCTRRKTKCDKQLPSFSTCIKIGVTCTIVRRQRLPRGRTARVTKSSSEQVLRDRMDHLESIVSRLQNAQPTPKIKDVSDWILQKFKPCPH